MVSAAVDVKRWLNESVRAMGPANDPDLEGKVSKLAVKIQMQADSVNTRLQSAGKEVGASAPKLVGEAERLTASSEALQAHLAIMEQRLQKVHECQVQSALTISWLSGVRDDVKACNEVLQKAKLFHSTKLSVQQGLREQAIAQVSEALPVLRECVGVLAGMDDHASRAEFLASAEQQLESLLLPQMLHALNTANAEECRELVKVYDQAGHVSEAHQHYIDCREGPLFEFWNAFQKGGLSEGEGTRSFSEWLPTFHASMVDALRREREWVAAVFGESGKDLHVRLLVVFMGDVCDSFRSRLQVAVGNTSQSLTKLLPLFSATLQHCDELLDSKLGSDEALEKLAISFLKPYEVFQASYASLERKLIADQLAMLGIDGAFVSLETSLFTLKESGTRVFKIANDVRRRFMQFTAAAHVHALQDIVNWLFEEYSKRFIASLTALQQGSRENKGNQSGQALEPHAPDNDDSDSDGGLDIALPSNREEVDFQLLHILLQLQPVTTALQTQLKAFEQDLVGKLMVANTALGSDKRVPLHLYLKANCAHLVGVLSKTCSKFAMHPESRMFTEAHDHVHRLKQRVQQFAVDTMLVTARTHIDTLPSLPELVSFSAPEHGAAFSCSPLPCITHIGQYLLMLPQHLESYASQGKEGELDASAWLQLVCTQLLEAYGAALKTIPPETLARAQPQLEADQAYLKNIVTALGVDLSSAFRDLVRVPARA